MKNSKYKPKPQVGDIWRTTRDQYYLILHLYQPTASSGLCYTGLIMLLDTGQTTDHFPIFWDDEKIA